MAPKAEMTFAQAVEVAIDALATIPAENRDTGHEEAAAVLAKWGPFVGRSIVLAKQWDRYGSPYLPVGAKNSANTPERFLAEYRAATKESEVEK